MKLLSFQKLNTTGIAHYVVPLLVVLIITVGGTFMLVASHADSPSPTAQHISPTARYSKIVKGMGTIKVAMYTVPTTKCTRKGPQGNACKGCVPLTDVGAAPSDRYNLTRPAVITKWSCTDTKLKLNRADAVRIRSADPANKTQFCLPSSKRDWVKNWKYLEDRAEEHQVSITSDTARPVDPGLRTIRCTPGAYIIVGSVYKGNQQYGQYFNLADISYVRASRPDKVLMHAEPFQSVNVGVHQTVKVQLGVGPQ